MKKLTKDYKKEIKKAEQILNYFATTPFYI